MSAGQRLREDSGEASGRHGATDWYGQSEMDAHAGGQQVEGDNLRLMQSMISPRCILMGSAKAADPGDGTQGSAGD
jgi:hypothetical protein